MATITSKPVLTDRKDKRLFCRLINKFRDEYYKNESPFDITPRLLDLMTDPIRQIYYSDKTPIAICEMTSGQGFGKTTLSVATVYVKPSYRGQGIANIIYRDSERIAKELDQVFYIQIEESSLNSNKQKFLNMGFTHFMPLIVTTSSKDYEAGYKEKAFALFTQNYENRHLKELA
jgi:GNAT superfamily N-acetyltransferase